MNPHAGKKRAARGVTHLQPLEQQPHRVAVERDLRDDARPPDFDGDLGAAARRRLVDLHASRARAPREKSARARRTTAASETRRNQGGDRSRARHPGLETPENRITPSRSVLDASHSARGVEDRQRSIDDSARGEHLRERRRRDRLARERREERLVGRVAPVVVRRESRGAEVLRRVARAPPNPHTPSTRTEHDMTCNENAAA